MQFDMHYYGTYAMARAAGLKRDVCLTIATAAQFVDDADANETIEFNDAGRLDVVGTARTLLDIRNTPAGEKDHRQTWVPFHFLPGNQGDTFTERLKCRMDSGVANMMIDHHLSVARCHYGIELIGVAAHVYADTFAHYGFSGISSRGNRVIPDSFKFVKLKPEMKKYVQKKAAAFFAEYGVQGGLFDNIRSRFGQKISGALGHGAVATYPDRPYLVWSFAYEYAESGARQHRNNISTYVRAARRLHDMFRRFGRARPDTVESAGLDFTEIEETVRAIIAFQGSKEKRCKQWQKAASKGLLFDSSEDIPEYDEKDWKNRWEALKGFEDSALALEEPVYRFYQATAHHRSYVLRHLLPSVGLVVA